MKSGAIYGTINDAGYDEDRISCIINKADAEYAKESTKLDGSMEKKVYSRKDLYYSTEKTIIVEEVYQALESNVATTQGLNLWEVLKITPTQGGMFSNWYYNWRKTEVMQRRM